jgi:tRNA (guanine37-N1)-methyltransferase
MVMKPEPLVRAIRWAREKYSCARTVLLSPQGRVFDQRQAERLARTEGMILVCGRYEGVDERVCNECIDEEISIGDYVLTGGELGAMVIIDAVTRLLPGALGGAESAEKDSFSSGLLEHAHYTRPPVFEGEAAPEVLLSGNHQAIENWRQETSLIRTFLKRPDLLARRKLSSQEIKILRKWCLDIEKIIDSQSLCGADALSGGQ